MNIVNLIKQGYKYLKENGFLYTVYKIHFKYIKNIIISPNNTYIKYIEDINYKLRVKSENPYFTQIAQEHEYYTYIEGDVKILAWYLPQYYQILINDKYYGIGFTEWTNTSRSMPLFAGHYQPRLPYDMGFYNLLNPDTLKRQAHLAKIYGIYGFVFDWYWFSGKRIMEKPIELFLKHREIDISFCIMWCTEDWFALWDGGNNECIFKQKLREEDADILMDDLKQYMNDNRYIKIDNCPVFIIYQWHMFEKVLFIKFIHRLRTRARQCGFPNLYIMLSTGVGYYNAEEWSCDAFVEYPTMHIAKFKNYHVKGYMNKHFKNRAGIFDYSSVIQTRHYFDNYKYGKVYRSVCVNFDNSPRLAFSPKCIITVNSTPAVYKEWLKEVIQKTQKEHDKKSRFTFVLAWNEWAESAYLEPDLMYGYAYLQATKEALEESKLVNDKVLLQEIELKKKYGIKQLNFYVHCIESIGDIVACEPIARYLKILEPTCRIIWIIKENAVEIVKYNPYIDNIIKVKNLSQAIDIIDESRTCISNIIVDCHQHGRRCATGRVHKNLKNPQIKEGTYLNYGPLLTNFCYSAGLPGLTDAPRFYLSPHEDDISSIPDPYVVIHCKSAQECKDWIDDKWNILAHKIINFGYNIVEVGCERVIKAHSQQYHDYTNIQNLQVTARIVKNADLFIGIDSLFAHIANCFDTYGIIIFSGKYMNFIRPMVYTGNYANGSTASIIYAEGERPAAYVDVNEVYEEFLRKIVQVRTVEAHEIS
jgi:ADP-heptose:LPS heptosyltransferase